LIIIDYGAGNLKNLKNAFDYLNVPVEISSESAKIAGADKLILPGVGAFGYAMQNLHQRDLVQPLIESVTAGVPLLGICLGMQLLFSASEEAPDVDGLNLIPGTVKRFQIGFKVPHMGWNELVPQPGSLLTAGIPVESYAYFVHSYYCVPENPAHSAAVTNYDIDFTSMVQYEHIFGTQFHPEKSQDVGLQILKNFVEFG